MTTPPTPPVQPTPQTPPLPQRQAPGAPPAAQPGALPPQAAAPSAPSAAPGAPGAPGPSGTPAAPNPSDAYGAPGPSGAPGAHPAAPGASAPASAPVGWHHGGTAAGHGGGWQKAAGSGASYASPIPIRRTHLGHALVSEWTKIRSVRSTMWTLGVFVVLVIGIGLLVGAQTHDNDYVDVPYTVPAFFGLVLGQICLITLGVLVISSEYGTGMIRTTFTASPQRYRVLAAKFLIYFAVAFVVSLVSIGLVGLAVSGMHSGASAEPWQQSAVKGALYVSLLGVLSLAVGSMLRHSAGAITTMLGVVLVPAILPAFLMIADSTREIGEKMAKYNAPSSLAMIFQLDSSSHKGTSQLWLLVGVTAAAVVAAFALLERRDV